MMQFVRNNGKPQKSPLIYAIERTSTMTLNYDCYFFRKSAARNSSHLSLSLLLRLLAKVPFQMTAPADNIYMQYGHFLSRD